MILHNTGGGGIWRGAKLNHIILERSLSMAALPGTLDLGPGTIDMVGLYWFGLLIMFGLVEKDIIIPQKSNVTTPS